MLLQACRTESYLGAGSGGEGTWSWPHLCPWSRLIISHPLLPGLILICFAALYHFICHWLRSQALKFIFNYYKYFFSVYHALILRINAGTKILQGIASQNLRAVGGLCVENVWLGFGEGAKWFMGKVNDLEWPCNIYCCGSEFLFDLFLHSLFYSCWKRLPTCWCPHNHSDSRLLRKQTSPDVPGPQHHRASFLVPVPVQWRSLSLLQVLWEEGSEAVLLAVHRLECLAPEHTNPGQTWEWPSFGSLPIGLTLLPWTQPKWKGPRKPRAYGYLVSTNSHNTKVLWICIRRNY